MTSPLRAVLLAALALSLVATGCGGDTKKDNEYVAAVNKAQTDFADSVSKLNSSGTAQGAKNVFANLESSIKKVVTDLKAVEPPDEVKDLHAKLVGSLTELEAQVGKTGDAVASGDTQALLKAQTEFGTSASRIAGEITTTVGQINQKLQE